MADESLVVNGGFEQTVNTTMGELVGWDVLRCDAVRPWFSPYVHKGQRALVFESNGRRYGLAQRVLAPQAQAFVLTAMVKAEGVEFGADGYARVEAQVNYDHILKSHFFLRFKAGTYGWTSVSFVGLPIAGLSITSIDLKIDARLQSGRLHLDGIDLTPDNAMAAPAAVLGRKIQDLQDHLAECEVKDLSIPVAQKHLADAIDSCRKIPGDLARARLYWEKAAAVVSHKVYAEMFPQAMSERAVEARVIYHGTGVSQEETDRYLAKIFAGRFNSSLLSLGTWDSVIYDSDVVRRIAAWKSFDALPYFLKKAHGRDMKVFGYVAAFYGLSVWPQDPGHIANLHPDWFAKNPHNPNMHVFPDPANPDAVDYIASIYVDLVNRFDLDGLGLDYIRYPEVYSLNYDERNHQAILDRFGIDILAADPTKNPDHWRKIQVYRAEQIDNAIATIMRRVHEVKPGLPVIASLISELDLSAQGVGQDWTISSRHLDYSSPMNYDDVSLYEGLLEVQRDTFARNDSVFIPAIGGMPRVQNSWTISEWARRIAVQRRIGCGGIAIYRVAELDPAVASFLGRGPFFNEAVFPETLKTNRAAAIEVEN